MDLPYPSQKDDQLSIHLSPFARKRSLILKDSLKHLPILPSINNSIKQKIINLIQQDYAYELRQLIDKEVINLNSQIGKQGSQQNMLHICCRANATQCCEFLIRTYFIYFPSEYESWVNAGNRERMTAVMLCALTASNKCLQSLLAGGGIDIHLIDSNKLSAYQIALNSKNQAAVKMLMDYENGSRKTKIINQNLLSVPLDLKPNKITICQMVYKCLLDCFSCSCNQQDSFAKNKRKVSNMLGSGIQCLFKEQVELGFPDGHLPTDEIEWKQLGEYQQRGEGGILYDTFSPFDMQDITFPLQNFLIIFQSLSQHPWLVRRIIQPDRIKQNHFVATIYPKNMCKNISIDSYLPFVAHTHQPLFIADKKEGWPMLLQKAMAKQYGSYHNLQQITTIELMQTLTGWPVIKRQITCGKQVIELMQKMNTQGYMYVLQGRPNSMLSCPTKPNCCFTVLTFYSKGDKRMALINCPFVDPAWVQKQRHEILALKILRGHYNCRQQMTIWVEEQRLKQYFSSILITPIRPGYQRYTLNSSVSKWLYFRIETVKDIDEPIAFYLVESDSGSLVKVCKVQGWFKQSQKVSFPRQGLYFQQIINFQGAQGEYLFRIEVPKGKYQIIGWACNQIKMQPLEQTFGGLQWVNCLRQNVQKHWILHTEQYTLIITKQQHRCTISGMGEVQVIEGKKQKGGSIQLAQSEQYRYCILKGNITNPIFEEI